MSIRKTVLSLAIASVLSSTLLLGQSFAYTSVNHNASSDAPITVNVFSSFDSKWSEHLQQQAGNVVANGATPLITWIPFKSENPDANILKEIVGGQQDNYINAWLNDLKHWLSSYPIDEQPKIAMRFAHEFHDTDHPWGSKPEAMKEAWRYLHNKFSKAGVSHSVDWVWCANNVDVANYSDITDYYPGDEYVDWLSIDGHRWGGGQSINNLEAFDQTFSEMYAKIIENFPNKPVMLAEISSSKAHKMPTLTEGKDTYWIGSVIGRIKEDYPAIKSIAWFKTNKEIGWALDVEENTALATYNKAASDKKFISTLDLAASSQKEESIQPILIAESKNTLDIAQIIKPEVVGSEVLAREARGIRKMSKAMLRKWRLNDILPR